MNFSKYPDYFYQFPPPYVGTENPYRDFIVNINCKVGAISNAGSKELQNTNLNEPTLVVTF
jgi:hypothetical protein